MTGYPDRRSESIKSRLSAFADSVHNDIQSLSETVTELRRDLPGVRSTGNSNPAEDVGRGQLTIIHGAASRILYRAEGEARSFQSDREQSRGQHARGMGLFICYSCRDTWQLLPDIPLPMWRSPSFWPQSEFPLCCRENCGGGNPILVFGGYELMEADEALSEDSDLTRPRQVEVVSEESEED